MRYDDFSTDVSKWSPEKLRIERRNGMPAVMAEITRRGEDHERRLARELDKSPAEIRRALDNLMALGLIT